MQPLIGLPVSLYGQLVGEDEAGYLPSQNAYLLGLEGHPEWGPTTINWYIEGSDTRSDMSRKTTSTTTTFTEAVIISKVTRWATPWAATARCCPAA